MQFANSILALLPILATSLAAPTAEAAAFNEIEFEYYSRHDNSCSSSTLSAITISETGKCYNLDHSARSFHFGGPTTEHQLPKRCTITGYRDKTCTGGTNLNLMGPTSKDDCYHTGYNMGQEAAVNSVIVNC